MKSILKRLLCTTVGAALISSGMCVFASEETSVAIEDYMYDAKTVYVDDDLEGGSLYPISTALTSSNSATEEDTGNTAVKISSWNSVVLIPAGKCIDADKIVVSVDMKPTGVSFSDAISGGTFDKTKRSFIGYGLYAGGSGEKGKIIQYAGTNIGSAPETLYGWMSWGSKGGNITVPQTNSENNGYVRAVAVYERAKNSDNGVYIRSLHFNGKDVIEDNFKDVIYEGEVNWWSDPSNPILKIQNRTGISLYNYYDNFLVYVPEDFKVKDMEYADDYSSANMHLTFGANLDDAEVILTSADGESTCSVSEGADRKEVVLDFGEPLDLENQSYYIYINGVKSLDGETLEGAKYLVSQKSADVTVDEPTVVQNAETGKDEVTGTFNVSDVKEADVGKTVYAVMSVWDETNKNCIDFKVEKIELTADGDPVEVKVPVEDAEKAANVQMFFVDGLDTMKIISNVFAETISK